MAWMQIETNRAAIEIVTRRAQLNIQSRMPQMRIHQKPAEMRIERNTPKMSINWDPYNAQLSMDKPMALMRRLSQQAEFKVREGISRVVNDGIQLSQIKGPSHADLAYARMMERNKVELSLRKTRDRPIVDWEGGSVKVNWTAHEFDIEWDTESGPIITVDPYEVEIRMRNYPSVKISLTKEYYESLMRGKLDKDV